MIIHGAFDCSWSVAPVHGVADGFAVGVDVARRNEFRMPVGCDVPPEIAQARCLARIRAEPYAV
jgi:hypothetical protein